MDSDQTQVVESALETTLQVAAAVSPNPAIQSAAVLAPIAIQFLQSAQQIQAAGLMTPEALAATFANIGQSIAATHQAWLNLNTVQPVSETA